MPEFNRNMLPLLGVQWHYFEHLSDAQAFADWAEAETCHEQHPCDTYITQDDLRPSAERFEVMVRNW